MREEEGGLPVTTASDDALHNYGRAVEAILAGRSEVDAYIDAALAADEDMPMAWVLRSLRERMAGRVPESRSSLKRALSRAATLSDRERSLIAFFDAYNRPDRFATERIGLEHLAAHPRDRIVVQYMHFLYNLLLPTTDRRERHQALGARHEADWDEDWFLLGERAFIATEAGRHAEARALAERALEARADSWPGAHAMAHALLETGAATEGRSWLTGWLEEWGSSSTAACHLTWHLALLVLADGDTDAAARRLDEILSFAGSTVMALGDGASLMWRLELEGGRDPLPWEVLEDISAPPDFPFATLHRALILAGLRRPESVRAEGVGVGAATAEACLALADFVEGDVAGAADRLLANEPLLVTIGGSRAQLEVLDDTLIASLAKSGRAGDAAERLAARLARRPSVRDRRWLASIVDA